MTINTNYFITTSHETAVSIFRLPHTQFHAGSSAISFRLPPDSISAAASSGSPLLSSLRFLASLGCPFHRFYPASFSLSDPRCFRALSTTSVLGSDYSASVSSFPFSSCSRLTVAFPVLRSCFRSFGFPRSFLPGFPCILSRFRYSASLYVSFHPSLIRSHSCSSGACLLLRFLASPSLPAFSVPLPLSFRLLSLTVLSFPASCLRLTVASSVLRFFLSASPFSTFFSAWFPLLLFRFPVLDLLLVSFRPALIHSRSRSSGDPLLNFFSGAGA